MNAFSGVELKLELINEEVYTYIVISVSKYSRGIVTIRYHVFMKET